jgi:uncharacterized protein YjcR
MSKKITKGAVAEYVRHQLKTNEKWAKAALLKIYEFQTSDEQSSGHTKYYNNVGFSGADSEFMSSLADQLRSKGWLSPKQMIYLHKRIHKYTRQIIEVSDYEKLISLVAKSK